MKALLLVAASLAALPAFAQSVTSLLPARNARTAPRNVTVEATLSQPVSLSANLTVFGTQMGGKKAGVTTRSGNRISVDPTVDFKAGETVMATLAGIPGPSQVWQFSAAVTGGTGIFSGGSDVPAVTLPSSMATGDLDGDGDLDMVASSKAFFGGFDGILVQLNTGQGAFVTGPSITGIVVNSLELGDVDGDGDLDVVCAAINQVRVLFNDGTGNFSVGTNWPTGNGNSALALGDIDGDGDLDMAVANLTDNSVTIRRNNGAGIFNVGTTLAGHGGWDLALGDADGDGDLDLWVPEYNDMYVLANDGSGSFSQWHTFSMGTSFNQEFQPLHIEITDLNNDGTLDVLAGADFTPGFPRPIRAVVKVFLQYGAGTFLPTPDLNGVGAYFTVGDLDGDGDQDVVTSTGSTALTACVRLNDGFGNFSAGTDVATPEETFRVVLGDLDGDGDLDLLARTFRQSSVSGTLFPVAVRFNGNSVLTTAKGTAPSTFNVWPNPVSLRRVCTVMLATPGPATYTLHNALGAQVRQASFRDGAEISLAGQAPGVYLLTVQAAGQAPSSRRIMVE